MLSVKDINNKRFEQARPGYKTEEVDDFLREIARDIERYQRDKDESEKKIAVLVESVREYKKDEEAEQLLQTLSYRRIRYFPKREPRPERSSAAPRFSLKRKNAVS